MDEGTFDVQQLLEAMPNLGASDLHLTVGSPPMYRINGDLRPVDLPPIKPDQTEEAMLNLTPPGKRTLLDAPRNPRPVPELANQLLASIAHQIAHDVIQFYQ